MIAAWAFIQRWWKVVAVAAAAVAFAIYRASLIGRGKDAERADQAARNDAARKEASDARDRALRSDDPRRELLDRFRRADGQ